MWKQAIAGRIMLKLYDGQTWRWIRYRLGGQATPDGWDRGSPHVVLHGGHSTRWWLHVPITRSMPRPQKVATQLAHVADAPDAPDAADANPQPLLCAVDLNSNDALAVCTLQRADGTVVVSHFLRGGDELHGRMKSLLGHIARNRGLSGIIAKGASENVALCAKIRHLDEDTAHRLSRHIVDFAHRHGASILVFEPLGSFQPERGKSSRRADSRRADWLRGRILRYSRHKAWNVGIVTCRVSPWTTSHHGARCARLGRQVEVARYEAGHPRAGYRPGAPLVWCPVCQREANADVNARMQVARVGSGWSPGIAQLRRALPHLRMLPQHHRAKKGRPLVWPSVGQARPRTR
jgi:transposase